MNKGQRTIAGLLAVCLRKWAPLSVLFVSCGFARAEKFYSVSGETDELYVIDAESGTVSLIGPIGIDVADPSLVSVGDRLFLVDNRYQEHARLIELDRATGAFLWFDPIRDPDGVPISTTAEAIAFHEGELIIAYNRGVGLQSLSNTIGYLSSYEAMDATIGSSVDFPSGTDLDGLSVVSGTLIGTDQWSGEGTQLYEVELAPPTLLPCGSVPWNRVYGLATTAGTLYAIEVDNLEILEFEPGSCTLAGQHAYVPPVDVRGLALAAPCSEDLDGSGDVGFADLLAVLSNWGPCVACPEDIDGDGDVGFSDLLEILSSWGPCVLN